MDWDTLILVAALLGTGIAALWSCAGTAKRPSDRNRDEGLALDIMHGFPALQTGQGGHGTKRK